MGVYKMCLKLGLTDKMVPKNRLKMVLEIDFKQALKMPEKGSKTSIFRLAAV